MDKGFAGPLMRLQPSGKPNRVVFLVTRFEESALNQIFTPSGQKKQPSGWME